MKKYKTQTELKKYQQPGTTQELSRTPNNLVSQIKPQIFTINNNYIHTIESTNIIKS